MTNQNAIAGELALEILNKWEAAEKRRAKGTFRPREIITLDALAESAWNALVDLGDANYLTCAQGTISRALLGNGCVFSNDGATVHDVRGAYKIEFGLEFPSVESVHDSECGAVSEHGHFYCTCE